MTIEDIRQAIMGLPYPDLTPLAVWLNSEEMPRREREEAKLEGMTELIETMPDAPPQVIVEDLGNPAIDVEDIPDWENPHTDHMKMYRTGAVVRHKGKYWISLLSRINEYEPSTTHPDLKIWVEWEPPAPEVPAEPDEPPAPEDPVEDTPAEPVEDDKPAPPAWKQPTGGHDAYKQGDLVTYEGAVWESLINNNSWSPTDYPQGWKKL